MDEQVREEKINWVTGHTGGTTLEILIITSTSIATYWFWRNVYYNRTKLKSPPPFYMEFLLLALPVLVVFTTPDRALFLQTLFWGLGLVLHSQRSDLSFKYEKLSVLRKVTWKEANKEETLYTRWLAKYKGQLPRLPWLSVYRAFMMLMTVVGILAVDFPIFPRRFAKVETFGTSLMDLGVGSVIFSLGVVVARIVLTKSSNGDLMAGVKHCLPVLVLGLFRMIMVKGINYHEHVSEYGVHWNFFFTLATVRLLIHPLTNMVVDLSKYQKIGLLVTIVHQYLLSKWGLADWIVNSERNNLLSMNKEGLTSILGYFSIFVLAVDIGILALPYPTKLAGYQAKTGKMMSRIMAYWFFYLISAQLLGIEVSRRMANMSYVFWVAAINTTFVGFFHGIYEISGPEEPEWKLNPPTTTTTTTTTNNKNAEVKEEKVEAPELLEAINDNSLLVFLIANVLTGIVNLSMDTLHTPIALSYLVMVGYLLSVCGIAVLLKRNGIFLFKR